VLKKTQHEEVLMEAQAMLELLEENFDGIITLIDQCAETDHINDHTRNKVEAFLLEALQANTANSQTLTDRALHAALKFLNDQESEDLADDKPRDEARTKLFELKNKVVKTRFQMRDLTGKK